MSKEQIKDIKHELRKELKRKYPRFRRLPKKEKKQVLLQLLNHIICQYDLNKVMTTSNNDLCGVEQIPASIYTLQQMEELYQKHHAGILPFKLRSNTTMIKDPELQFIHELCDWSFINQLIAPPNYAHHQRDKFPVHLFKAELLHSLKYAELSYRKFCEREINNKERKENRAFIGLKAGQQIDHSQLSKFRNDLPYDKLINMMTYFIYMFLKEKDLPKDVFYVVDSTELAEKINSFALVRLKVGKEEIRLYQDIDADAGTRRTKRDKSKYVVGYRLHTLTVIDPQKQIAYPLLSILASANHHDSNFLPMLIELGKAIGLEIKFVVGDQAYENDCKDESQNKHNITILTQPKTVTKLPEDVDPKSYQVYMNNMCEISMTWYGKTENSEHEYHCSAEPGRCPLEGCCDKVRHISLDSGAFGQIPYHISEVQQLCKMRKVAERPFNLLKHREGLEPLRTGTKEAARTVTVIANIATLLIEIAGFRRSQKMSKNEQLNLFANAA